MISTRTIRLQALLLLAAFLLTAPALSYAAGLSDLLGKKEVDEEERKQTIERIESIQEKLKLLQDKLRALERRKASKKAAERAESIGAAFSETPVRINWSPVDETTIDPGEYGLYTYLLYKGSHEDMQAIGVLEDFILTIETLQSNDIPPGLANRFLVPVERPQSLVKLGRQPYDFKLNDAYMRRLALDGSLPNGPVLVSLSEPVDPYGVGETPDYMAVGLGQQAPEKAARFAGIWHRHEKNALVSNVHAVAELFWQVIDGIGPVQVSRNQQSVVVALPQ